MTVREALRLGSGILDSAGVPDARLDAEYLMAGVLDVPRLLALAAGDTQLTDRRTEEYLDLIGRRASREPLQYILGTQSFMGFIFRVRPLVLIPRQDTETLCEQALLWAPEGGSLLDLCTGSGALAIAIKKLREDLAVTATDISGEALDLARENALALDAEVRFLQGDLLAPVRGERFDVIVSNPPYIPTADIPGLQAEVLKEPALALDGGPDGLAFYRRITEKAKDALNAGGALLMEIGCSQAADVRALMNSAGFTGLQTVRDMAGLDRVVAGRL